MSDFRALLVDDEEELVTALVERLGYRGVSADYALSGGEALVKIRERDYDVVVLDLKMPGMSGTEVLEAIRIERPDLPVLMITGHGSPDEEENDQLPPGAYDYLPKPIRLEELLKKMQEAAGKQ